MVGVFMRNWDGAEEGGDAACSAEADRADARRVCDALNIPLHEADFVREYWTRVFDDFLAQVGRCRPFSRQEGGPWPPSQPCASSPVPSCERSWGGLYSACLCGTVSQICTISPLDIQQEPLWRQEMVQEACSCMQPCFSCRSAWLAAVSKPIAR